MDVWQIPADRHPLLSALYALLREHEPRQHTLVVNDELQRSFVADPPSGDRPNPQAGLREFEFLPALVEAAGRVLARWGDEEITTRAVNYYPAGGGIGWHTNSNFPGWRVYIVRTAPQPRSRFLIPQGAIPDRDGVANVFKVEPGAWHAVDAATERWSFGMRISDGLAAQLRQLGAPARIIPRSAAR